MRRGGSAYEALTSLFISHDNSTPNYSKLLELSKNRQGVTNRLIATRTRLGTITKAAKKTPRLLIHVGIAAAIVAIVVSGSLSAQDSAKAPVAAEVAAPLSNLVDNQTYGELVDKTASAYIAAGVASEVELPVAERVVKHAQTLTSQINQVAISDSDSYLQKPQVLTTQGNINDIRHYVVAEGDSLASIADKFDISLTTIREANGLTAGEEPSVGKQLVILPVNGVLHTVSATDTPQSLALLYHTSAQQIISFNDAEVTGLKPGTKIIIPGGVLISGPQQPTFATSFYRPVYGNNSYAYGFCTWYVASRIAVPNNWGDAWQWAANAAASGWNVSSTPSVGAIAQRMGGLGHVAIVEAVSPDGKMMKYSDMNGLAGFGAVGRSGWVSISEFQNYITR